MSRGLVVFEDDRWAELSPLADLTPVPALRFGRHTLAERWGQHSGAASMIGVTARAATGTRVDPDEVGEDDLLLAVNAAALPGPWLEAAWREDAPVRFTCGGRLVAARMVVRDYEAAAQRAEPSARGFAALAPALPQAEQSVEAEFLARPWDFVAGNAAALDADAAGFYASIAGEVDPRAVLLEPERIRIERGARVDALAVLDARDGFIRIGREVVVHPHTVVRGPCDVGDRTELLGGLIARSTIGPDCRLAGEVEECIFQGYGNKRHHGFVGHSVIGQWVNLGALTTTSDLKNNYGEVRAWAAGEMRATGLTKLGALIGDHVKTGIGTLLPTGASVGVGANLFGGGRFAPKRVPSFAWWDGERTVDHRLDEMLATARTATSRRGRTLDAAEESRLRELFAASAKERQAAT